MKLWPIGAKVRVIRGANRAGETGEVVAGTLWTANERDPGDRVVRMDSDGARLVYEHYFLEAK